MCMSKMKLWPSWVDYFYCIPVEKLIIILVCIQKEAVVQQLYMGRSPPMFTEMRVLQQSTGDDHLVWNPVLVIVDLLNDIFFLVLIHLFLSHWNFENLWNAGIGVGNEFSYCRRYGCCTCCTTNEEIGFWNVGKVAFDRHACWREGNFHVLIFSLGLKHKVYFSICIFCL